MEPLEHYKFDPGECERVWTDHENYYSVLLDRHHSIVVLEVVITWIAWYEVYFWLSVAEYELFQSDRKAFASLTERYAADKGERFYAHKLLQNGGPSGGSLAPALPIPIPNL